MIERSASTWKWTASKLERGIRLPVFPLVGLSGVAIGTIAALMTLPEDLKSPDSFFCSSLLMSLGLALGPIIACVSEPRAILRVENVISLSPILWLLLEALQMAADVGSLAKREQVAIVLQAIGLFVGGMWLARMFRPRKLPASWRQSLSYEPSARALFAIAVAAFGLGMLRFAIPCGFNLSTMISALKAGRWEAPWGRGALGGWDAFLDHLAYFGYLLPTLAVLLARRMGWTASRTLVVVAMSMVMLMFLAQGGGRRIIGVTCGAALVTFVLGAPRLHVRTVIVSLGVVIAMLWVTAKMLEMRDAGFGSRISSTNSAAPWREAYHVDNNMRSFAELAYFVPARHPFVYHKYFIWLMARPIPRVFWPGKPEGPGFDLPKAMGERGVSLSVTLVGELYMAGGLLMVVAGGVFYGRLAGTASGLLELKITASSLLTYGLATLALLAGMRSGIELILMSYPLLAWAALICMMRPKQASVAV